MGKLSVVIPDDLEDRFRRWLVSKYGLKFRGKMGKHIAEAIEEFLDRQET